MATEEKTTPKVIELLGDNFRKPDGSVVGAEALKVDVVGLYFSAHWCPPCRGFTPVLGKKYKALKEAGKSLEIVFVSSDRDDKAFQEYHNEQPWLALPFAKRDEKGTLSSMFGVRGIPSLVFVDANTGKTITTEGRSGVSASSFVEDFPYHPKPVNDLSGSTSGIQDKKSLVVLMEHSEEDQQKELSSALLGMAESLFSEEDESQHSVQRLFTGKGGGPLSQVRKLCGLPSFPSKHEHPLEKKEGNRWNCDGCGSSGAGKDRYRCTEGCDFDYCDDCHVASGKELSREDRQPTMLILDLADQGAFYLPAKAQRAVTAENLKAFVAAFAAKELTRNQTK